MPLPSTMALKTAPPCIGLISKRAPTSGAPEASFTRPRTFLTVSNPSSSTWICCGFSIVKPCSSQWVDSDVCWASANGAMVVNRVASHFIQGTLHQDHDSVHEGVVGRCGELAVGLRFWASMSDMEIYRQPRLVSSNAIQN